MESHVLALIEAPVHGGVAREVRCAASQPPAAPEGTSGLGHKRFYFLLELSCLWAGLGAEESLKSQDEMGLVSEVLGGGSLVLEGAVLPAVFQ